MRVTVHAVAGKMPAWVDHGVADYAKRLPRDFKLQWRDVPLGHRSGGNSDIEKTRGREGAALLKGVPTNEHCIAMHVAGKSWSTEALARELRQWMLQGQPLGFMIGGPDGLSPECLERADQRWSLGPMVLPHALVRIVLIEQLYRAWTITIGHPYHRG